MYKNIICGIYCIENIKNNKKYIGQSINVYDRWNKHKNELRKNIHDNDYLQKSWNKYGEENFKFYIIEECDKNSLDEKEIYYINFYNSLNKDFGYNLKEGGQSGAVSEYGNEKRKNSLKKYYSETDRKEIQRQNALKQWANPEIKAKICGENNGMFGKTHSQEARQKISDSRKGKISPNRNTTPVLCIELNKIFNSAIEAKKELNITSPILEVCYGHRKTAGGYRWKFIMENNI